MLEKLLQTFRDLAYFTEQARRNGDEIKDLRNRQQDLALAVQRLALEIERLRENETHEREKLLLKIENRFVGQDKPSVQKPRKLLR